MKKIILLIASLVNLNYAFSQTPSPASPGLNTLAQARQKGEAQAKADIAKGTMQILYYGKPWPQDKPLVDDESGLPVKIAEGCCVMPEFVAETDAYNRIMRQTAKAKAEKRSANSVSDPGDDWKPPDHDHDGLPDDLEGKTEGLDPDNPKDAGADPDNDGFTTAEEVWAGTNFRNREDRPSLATRLRVVKTVIPPFPILLEAVAEDGRIPKEKWDIQLKVRHEGDHGWEWQNLLGAKLGATITAGGSVFRLMALDKLEPDKDNVRRYSLVVEDDKAVQATIKENDPPWADPRRLTWVFAYYMGPGKPRILNLSRGSVFTLEDIFGKSERYLLNGPAERPWVQLEREGGGTVTIRPFRKGEFETTAETIRDVDAQTPRGTP